MRMNRRAMAACLVSGLLTLAASVPAAADPGPRAALVMKKGLQAGLVRDGARLGEGVLASRDPHAGFCLWSDAGDAAGRGGRYVLQGRADPRHRLRVRLVPRGLPVAESPGTGVAVRTAEGRVTVDVVSDGDQAVPADRYALSLRGALLAR